MEEAILTQLALYFLSRSNSTVDIAVHGEALEANMHLAAAKKAAEWFGCQRKSTSVQQDKAGVRQEW